MFTLTLTVGMFSETVACDTRESAEARGNEWMEEQRSTVDAEVASGNLVAAEIPFSFAVHPGSDMSPRDPQTTDLLDPPCDRLRSDGMSGLEACPRCGVSGFDECDDYAAYEAQLNALTQTTVSAP